MDEALDTWLDTDVEAFVSICRDIGGDISGLGNLVQNTMRHVQSLAYRASVYARPANTAALARPIAAAVEEAHELRDKQKLSYDHTTAVAFMLESALWVNCVNEDAVEFIRECMAQSERYFVKVKTLHKPKDEVPMELHVQFVSRAHSMIATLIDLVDSYSPAGLIWNSEGRLFTGISSSSESMVASQEIIEGSISRLRGKWVISGYQNMTTGLPVEDVNMKQTLHIRECSGCVVVIPGKLKHIFVDSCSACSIEVNEVLSSLEVSKSCKLKLSISQTVPSVQFEDCDGCELTLSQSCIDLSPDIITSNVREINLLLPSSKHRRDHVELAIPQSFCTKITGGLGAFSLDTEPVKYF